MFLKLNLLFSFFSVAMADICYSYSGDGAFESIGNSHLCAYGCCDQFTKSNPCCSFPAGIIAGIVVGVVFLIAMIVVAICIGRRHYRRTIVTTTYAAPLAVPQVITTNTNTIPMGYAAGQPTYPAGGQPAYPAAGQPAYPAGGQPAYPAGGQPAYPAGGQPGYVYPAYGQPQAPPPYNNTKD